MAHNRGTQTQDLTNHIKNFQTLSPTKKIVYKAFIDYLVIEYATQSTSNLLTRFFQAGTMDDRMPHINSIMSFLGFGDDAFIANMKRYLDTVFTDPSSKLRSTLLVAVSAAEASLEERRRHTKIGIRTAGVAGFFSASLTLAAWTSSSLTFGFVGIPALVLYAVCAEKVFSKSTDLLEIWDHSYLLFSKNPEGRESFCPEVYSSYHNLKR